MLLHEVCRHQLMKKTLLFPLAVLLVASAAIAQDLHPSGVTPWLTTPDRKSLLAPQTAIAFHPLAEGNPDTTMVAVDGGQRFQTVDGFGLALTGGSAQLIMAMSQPARKALLHELFGNPETNGNIGISYIRVSIGSSDMNDHVYTYDDLPQGQADLKLQHFSLQADEGDVIPVLKAILAIRPDLRILASPWSAPSWMKTNGTAKGGSLRPEYYDVYARYLVRYLKDMRNKGVRIDAITLQNEPLNPKNTPSLVMTAEDQAAFLGKHFGPLLQHETLGTKVVLYDHNCDRPDYPAQVLADPVAYKFANGSGFHLYGGEISAMSSVHDAFPSKNVYFTEQMVIDHPGATELAIADPEARVVIGALRNWSRNVLLWNLAADPKFGPHTPDGGCPICEGAITIDGNRVQRNLAYYVIAQAAKFVPPGSVRVASDQSAEVLGEPHREQPQPIADVAFRTPSGRFVLIVANPTAASRAFSIVFHGQQADAILPGGSVATYVW
jgi:glucosylceramidase